MDDDVLKRFESFRMPTFEEPSYRIPDFNFPDIQFPDRSASGLLEALDTLVGQWRKELPPDAQPVILVVLTNGVVIEAHDFAEAGHNGIGIRGRLGDGSDCLVVVHQSSLQLLCRVVKTENPQQRYPIGFRYSSKT